MANSLTLAANDDDKIEAQPETPRKRRIFARLAVGAVVVAAVAAGGHRYMRWAEQFESTDDAFLDGKLHAVSTRVNGTVIEVLTDDNRIVKAGDPLLKLDPRDFEVRLEEAKGDLVSADASVAQAEAQIAQAYGSLGQAKAMMAQTKAQQDKAALDYQRADALVKSTAIPRADFDTANANSEIAAANSASAESTRAAASASLRAAQSNLNVARARKAVAEAKVHDAELQLSYTTVYAPTDGRIGKKTIEVGQHVQPGQALLAVVDNDVWVVANFKEGQLTNMRPGQTVEVGVDAVDGRTFTATIESVSPGTGAKFSLLPPDNATGNFTKIVQRVPVKIRFNSDSVKGYEDRLFPGLSVLAKVRVKP